MDGAHVQQARAGGAAEGTPGRDPRGGREEPATPSPPSLWALSPAVGGAHLPTVPNTPCWLVQRAPIFLNSGPDQTSNKK